MKSLFLILCVISLPALAEVQVCQYGRCQPETDPIVLQCVELRCKSMTPEGDVFMCKPGVCVDRPQVLGFKQHIRVNLNLGSRHFRGPSQDSPVLEYHQENYGIGGEWVIKPDLYVGAGYYQNSFDVRSHYITLGTALDQDGAFTSGVEAGFADGYEIAGDTMNAPKITEDITFIGGLWFRVGTENFGIKTMISVDFIGVQAQLGHFDL